MTRETKAQSSRRHARESALTRTTHLHLLGAPFAVDDRTPNQKRFESLLFEVLSNPRISPAAIDTITDLVTTAWDIGHGLTGDLNIDLKPE